MKKYILSIDHGTTGTRAILFDRSGAAIARAYRELSQIYPQPGWVEHNPEEIWNITAFVIKEVLKQAQVGPADIAAIGIANQGETVVVWNRFTGKPIYNAIVWQCRRTSSLCSKLVEEGYQDKIQSKTGLVIDPYFSATKVQWILDNVPNARVQAENGELLLGTTDTWLVWKLTAGRAHLTDYSTASRTMMFNIHSLEWDQEILDLLSIPRVMLPKVVSSSGVCAKTDPFLFDGQSMIIAGLAVDQQAALFGQGCYERGMLKCTYGTGSFMLMNTGESPVKSTHGLLSSIAWNINGRINYVLDGAIYVAGAAVQWLRDGLRIIENASQTDELASKVPDTGGVYFVPAFAGLAAPYWDTNARGTIVGLTRGTTREHLVRATLESIAYRVRDVVAAMQEDSGIKIEKLRVDGGVTANKFLMQFQADILGIPVELPPIVETTALGVAYLAGLAVGYWDGIDEIKSRWRARERFVPNMGEEQRSKLYAEWKRALNRAKGWAVDI
ncbi:MAG: glycerol kinase GlpK [Firmicutes bacterium]|nr:glycerol kinase GlpK [Bacillota bacterium]